MATTITSSNVLNVAFQESNPFQIGTQKSSPTITNPRNYAAGSGANQINVASGYTETLGAAANTTYTLSDGSMKTSLNQGATFTALKRLTIVNTGDTNDITISGNFFGISTESIDIPPGGHFDMDYGSGSGEAVTGTSKDEIDIASTLGSTYKMMVQGVGSIS